MTRQVIVFLRYALTIALALGVVLSSNARLDSHDINDLTKIVAEHNASIEDHGHDHEDIIDIIHAYYGHAHDAADHDHNIAFLPPREMLDLTIPKHTNWLLAKKMMPGRKASDLERPPRV